MHQENLNSVSHVATASFKILVGMVSFHRNFTRTHTHTHFNFATAHLIAVSYRVAQIPTIAKWHAVNLKAKLMFVVANSSKRHSITTHVGDRRCPSVPGNV